MTPLMVTGTLVPCTPTFGLMLVRVGPGAVTVKVTALLVPPAVVALMLCGPCVAVAAMARMVVIWVAAMLEAPPKVMPAGRFNVAPSRLVPVMVTATLLP